MRPETAGKDPTFALSQKLRALTCVEGEALYRKLESLALEEGLWSEVKGRPVPLKLAASPWFLDANQMAYLQRVSWQMRNSLKTLTNLWFHSTRAKELLPLEALESSFFELFGDPSGLPVERLFCRLDALCRFNGPDWKESLRFLENNVVGIGGMTYAPAANLITERLFELLSISHPTFRSLPDPRTLLAEELFEQARARGLQGEMTVALVDDLNQYSLGGEMGRLARFFQGVGIRAIAADARDLELDRHDQFRVGDCKIDLVYRFVELRELLETPDCLHALRPLWTAFQRGIVVPSLAGDLDHKSTFELLTSEEFASHFSPEWREVHRLHVPWTRLLYERQTKTSSGHKIDLFDYAEKNRRSLVIKPNRDYGGNKVLLGSLATPSEWREALNEASCRPRSFVLQEGIDLVEETLPCLESSGEVDWSVRYLSLGLFPNARQTGALGRFADGPVVNISQNGGVVPLIVLEH
jgi:hypothetical protein